MTIDRIPDFSRSNIMVLGDVMLDRYLVGSIDRISPEAPVPVLRLMISKICQEVQQCGTESCKRLAVMSRFQEYAVRITRAIF